MKIAPLALSSIGHFVILGWVSQTLPSAKWERAAGSPGPLREVSVWESVTAAKPGQAKPASPVLAKGEAVASSVQEGASSEKAESKGNFGAGGTSLSYRAILHAFLDQSKTYPAALRELGLSGSVHVHFRVTREGTLIDIHVPEQAAPGPLRAEASRFLRRLRQVPVPPAELAEEELRFELPLRFEPS